MEAWWNLFSFAFKSPGSCELVCVCFLWWTPVATRPVIPTLPGIHTNIKNGTLNKYKNRSSGGESTDQVKRENMSKKEITIHMFWLRFSSFLQIKAGAKRSQQAATSCPQGGKLIPFFSILQLDSWDLLDLTSLDPHINADREDCLKTFAGMWSRFRFSH